MTEISGPMLELIRYEIFPFHTEQNCSSPPVACLQQEKDVKGGLGELFLKPLE